MSLDLVFEDRLQRLERSLAAHDFLLRALLAHMAMAAPESFDSMISGFARSQLYGRAGQAGELPGELAEELVMLLENIAASVRQP